MLDGQSITQIFTVTVTNTNDLPIWDNLIGDFTIFEDSPISGRTAEASDEDAGDTPTYSFDLVGMSCDDGAWISLGINTTTGILSGTPTNADVGSCTIKFVFLMASRKSQDFGVF